MPVPDMREKTFREALFSGEMDMPGMDSVLSLYRDLYPERKSPEKPERDLHIPDKEEAVRRLGEGLSIFNPAEILPDPEGLSDKGKDVSLILIRHSENPNAIREVTHRILTDPAAFLDLARSRLLNDRRSQGAVEGIFADVSLEILEFIIFNATKSFFISAARNLGDVDTLQWNHGRCPVCGDSPAAACLVGEESKRFLICHRCEASWSFKGSSCPYCGEEGPQGARYVSPEDPTDQRMRGQVCDRCKSYIKTWRFESDDLQGHHPEVEDLKTPGFDVALQAEGFRRGGANVFGIVIGSGK